MKKHLVVPRVHAGSLPGAGKAQHLSGDAAPSWLYTAPLTGDCTAGALRPSQKQVFLSPQAKKPFLSLPGVCSPRSKLFGSRLFAFYFPRSGLQLPGGLALKRLVACRHRYQHSGTDLPCTGLLGRKIAKNSAVLVEFRLF